MVDHENIDRPPGLNEMRHDRQRFVTPKSATSRRSWPEGRVIRPQCSDHAVKSLRLLLAAACVIPSLTAQSQVLNSSARDILNTGRTLQPAEIAVVLAATREAVSGKTLRLSYVPNGPGPEVLAKVETILSSDCVL
jgi:hypothetical protein